MGGQLSARPYSPSPTKIPMRHAVARINDATRRATSLQTLRCLHDHAGITIGNGGLDRMRACGGQVGGGIFAKTAKTPPLQSGVCGDFIAVRIAPKGRPLPPPPCAYHAHPACLPPETLWFLQRRGAPRRDKKTHVSLRGMVYAWRRWQWAAFGRNADRNADCRGGVFAVPREDSPAHRHARKPRL